MKKTIPFVIALGAAVLVGCGGESEATAEPEAETVSEETVETAFAQEVLGQVGPYFFTNNPTRMEQQFTATSEAHPLQIPRGAPAPTSEIHNTRSVGEASTLAGFEILVPENLPDGYELVNVRVTKVMPDDSSSIVVVNTQYQAERYQDALYIQQRTYSLDDPRIPFEFRVGDAKVVELQVREQSGIWVEGTNLHYSQVTPPSYPEPGVIEHGEIELIPWNLLLWEENKFLFLLHSPVLSQGNMLSVAESLEQCMGPINFGVFQRSTKKDICSG